MKRGALITLAVLVLVVGAALVYVYGNLDAIVARAIETHGSRIVGTEVTVGSVEVRLSEAKGTIRDLRVANPEGFDAPHAFAWDEVTIDIDTGSLSGEPWVLDAVRIAAPEVVLAADATGRINLRELQRNLASDDDAPDEDAAPGPERRLRIRRFVFERGRVDLRTRQAGGRDVAIDLPKLELEELGGADGATPGELGRTLLRAYTAQVLKSAARSGIGGRVGELLDDALGGQPAGVARGLLERLVP